MDNLDTTRRNFLAGAAVSAVAALIPFERASAALSAVPGTDSITFKKIATPQWVLDFWKEIDDKTFGKGFDCFAENAIGNLGVADWHGRESIRENLRQFIDKGMTTQHAVAEFWDGGSLKVFRGFVHMKFDDPSKPSVRPVMSHFFYMDPKDSTKVIHWFGAVGPVAF